MHSPKEIQLEVVYKILWYLKGSPDKGLFFKKIETNIKVFTNTDWANSVEDRRSTTGYCTFIFENLVTWQSKKQNIVARNNGEIEFKEVVQGICEAL